MTSGRAIFGRVLPAATAGLLTLGGLVALPAPSDAQQVSPAFQGLFNGTGRTKPRSLWLSFSVEAADDRNDASGPAKDGSLPPRTYSDALGEMRFDRNTRAFSVSASGSAALRADTASGGNAALLKNVLTGSIATAPQKRTGFRLSGSRIDAPFTLLTLEGPTGVDSADLVSAASDHFLTNRRTVIENATAAVSERLGRRTTMVGEYDIRRSTGFIGLADLTTQRASARIDRELTRALSVNAGYSYQIGSYGRASRATLNNREADAGLDYKPHAGKFQFGFGGGTATVDEIGRTARYATGFARADRAVGRAWTVHAEYRRALDVATGFDRALLADSASASVGGFLTKRIDVLGFGGLWFTQSATTGVAAYHSQRVGGRVRVALTRMFAVYGEYLHYQYRFDPQAQVPLSLSETFARRGVRFGVVSRLPLFR